MLLRAAPGCSPGCSWLLLAAPGCSPGCSWLLSWLLLAAPGCPWLPLAAPGCPWAAASGCSPGCSWPPWLKSQIFHTISRFLKMVHFLYQISTFSYFEGWGTCLAVQPASRMLLAGLWLLPDFGCALLVLLAHRSFRIPGVGLAALGCSWLLSGASGPVV